MFNLQKWEELCLPGDVTFLLWPLLLVGGKSWADGLPEASGPLGGDVFPLHPSYYSLV